MIWIFASVVLFLPVANPDFGKVAFRIGGVALLPVILLAMSGCTTMLESMTTGWYKDGATSEQFAQDNYACMAASQTEVSQAYVNGTVTPYYGSVNGAASTYQTTNNPLFASCMGSRGWVWSDMNTAKKRGGRVWWQ